MELLDRHVSEAKEQGVAIIQTRSGKAVTEKCSGVGEVRDGRRQQLLLQRWEYADRVKSLIWD